MVPPKADMTSPIGTIPGADGFSAASLAIQSVRLSAKSAGGPWMYFYSESNAKASEP